jgi:hypothetical protein
MPPSYICIVLTEHPPYCTRCAICAKMLKARQLHSPGARSRGTPEQIDACLSQEQRNCAPIELALLSMTCLSWAASVFEQTEIQNMIAVCDQMTSIRHAGGSCYARKEKQHRGETPIGNGNNPVLPCKNGPISQCHAWCTLHYCVELRRGCPRGLARQLPLLVPGSASWQLQLPQ